MNVTCACGRAVKLPPGPGGKKFRCPGCGAVLAAPARASRVRPRTLVLAGAGLLVLSALVTGAGLYFSQKGEERAWRERGRRAFSQASRAMREFLTQEPSEAIAAVAVVAWAEALKALPRRSDAEADPELKGDQAAYDRLRSDMLARLGQAEEEFEKRFREGLDRGERSAATQKMLASVLGWSAVEPVRPALKEGDPELLQTVEGVLRRRVALVKLLFERLGEGAATLTGEDRKKAAALATTMKWAPYHAGVSAEALARPAPPERKADPLQARCDELVEKVRKFTGIMKQYAAAHNGRAAERFLEECAELRAAGGRPDEGERLLRETVVGPLCAAALREAEPFGARGDLRGALRQAEAVPERLMDERLRARVKEWQGECARRKDELRKRVLAWARPGEAAGVLEGKRFGVKFLQKEGEAEARQSNFRPTVTLTLRNRSPSFMVGARVGGGIELHSSAGGGQFIGSSRVDADALKPETLDWIAPGATADRVVEGAEISREIARTQVSQISYTGETVAISRVLTLEVPPAEAIRLLLGYVLCGAGPEATTAAGHLKEAVRLSEAFRAEWERQRPPIRRAQHDLLGELLPP